MEKTENYIQQLADYIKRNLSKGYTLDSLKIALENQDYSRSSIDRAIRLVNEQLARQAPIMKEKPKIIYEIIKDEIKEVGKEKKHKKHSKSEKKKNFLKRLFE
jgi:DNA-binding transcriptional MerR regulator